MKKTLVLPLMSLQAHVIWGSTHCSHSLPLTNCLLCFSSTLSPPISPSLSQYLFSFSVTISPSSLSPPLLCFSVHQAAAGGVSEEDAWFRARCCWRMALRIQGKRTSSLLCCPSWLMLVKCSPGGHLFSLQRNRPLLVKQLWWKSVERASVGMSHISNRLSLLETKVCWKLWFILVNAVSACYMCASDTCMHPV